MYDEWSSNREGWDLLLRETCGGGADLCLFCLCSSRLACLAQEDGRAERTELNDDCGVMMMVGYLGGSVVLFSVP